MRPFPNELQSTSWSSCTQSSIPCSSGAEKQAPSGDATMRWTGFSRQPTSLTSNAGNRPSMGLRPMSMRRTHRPELKARGAMEAISSRKVQQIADDHSIHPIQVGQWKRQLLDGASELITRGNKSKYKEEVQVKEAELFQQIGRLRMELEWLRKKSQLL